MQIGLKGFLIIATLGLVGLGFVGCGGSDGVCIGLQHEECKDNQSCEAIPYWGESLIACNVDDRGFSDNCPYEGCRPRDSDCPSLTDLVDDCEEYCSYNSFQIDPDTGCRTCECRTNG
jgi:hypothetical protein